MNSVHVVLYRKRFASSGREARRILLRALREMRVTNSLIEVALVPSTILHKNVYSYPAPSQFVFGKSHQGILGDIYLNPDYIQDHKEDFQYMVIHGLLHLLGYDHVTTKERRAMEGLEKRLLRS